MWTVDSSKEYGAWFETLDEDSKIAVLAGGDKKGKNQEKFYKDLISESEAIIERHEKELNK